jgi:fatty acid desaturase
MMLFKSVEGAYRHSAAIVYSLATYTLGWSLLFLSGWAGFLPGLLLLAHGLIIGAYLIHECAHNTVFRSNKHNASLGKILGWLCGSSYGTQEDIRYKHFRHHVDNDDVVWFDYEAFFLRHPLFYRVTILLEWFYIPAHDLLMHTIMMFSAFIIPQRHSQRVRNLIVILIRGSLMLGLAVWFPAALLGYIIAYMLMIIVLRFMDGLEHDYPYHLRLYSDEVSEHKGDLAWEQEHTFSPMISWRYPRLNWLVLNFGYHNAHHARPTTPWYELPALHEKLFGSSAENIIPLWPQLVMYHRYRIYRIFHDAPGLTPVSGNAFLKATQQARVTGGNAASFLTSF